jgi:hypothetical protein
MVYGCREHPHHSKWEKHFGICFCLILISPLMLLGNHWPTGLFPILRVFGKGHRWESNTRPFYHETRLLPLRHEMSYLSIDKYREYISMVFATYYTHCTLQGVSPIATTLKWVKYSLLMDRGQVCFNESHSVHNVVPYFVLLADTQSIFVPMSILYPACLWPSWRIMPFGSSLRS